ncbi:MAG: hypothetical protein R3F17_08440 [Planctomycetota bacterium]
MRLVEPYELERLLALAEWEWLDAAAAADRLASLAGTIPPGTNGLRSTLGLHPRPVGAGLDLRC